MFTGYNNDKNDNNYKNDNNDKNDHLKGFDTSSYAFQIPELECGWAS